MNESALSSFLYLWERDESVRVMSGLTEKKGQPRSRQRSGRRSAKRRKPPRAWQPKGRCNEKPSELGNPRGGATKTPQGWQPKGQPAEETPQAWSQGRPAGKPPPPPPRLAGKGGAAELAEV